MYLDIACTINVYDTFIIFMCFTKGVKRITDLIDNCIQGFTSVSQKHVKRKWTKHRQILYRF